MKKLLVTSITAAAILGASIAPAFADVIRTSGSTTGQPVAAVSNPGSTQGQANRSDTGTVNKFTHDGFRLVVE
ncbi:hypothetical protein [Alicyclobacillus herbarius]|uniref:hypothetical protein n=1 Tax=Alicyclobacillus herbarius TaxID=122960 RepID=UPI0003FEEA74|nr:hypothetical protein [Alicyclobacillus herbarius]